MDKEHNLIPLFRGKNYNLTPYGFILVVIAESMNKGLDAAETANYLHCCLAEYILENNLIINAHYNKIKFREDLKFEQSEKKQQ